MSILNAMCPNCGHVYFTSSTREYDNCIVCNANYSLQGAKIEFNEKCVDENTLKERYDDEKADPIHAAKDGYLDCIIEPQFVKQYLISALQMLGK